jgi:hypothetical protein
MLNVKDASIVFETLLASPGMNDEVKITLRIPRKTILLLAKLISVGLSAKDLHESGIFSAVNGETTDALKELSNDILSKAGLTEMSEKLEALQSK